MEEGRGRAEFAPKIRYPETVLPLGLLWKNQTKVINKDEDDVIRAVECHFTVTWGLASPYEGFGLNCRWSALVHFGNVSLIRVRCFVLDSICFVKIHCEVLLVVLINPLLHLLNNIVYLLKKTSLKEF